MIIINDLSRQDKKIQGEIQREVTQVLESGWYVLGKQVQGFEQEFADYCQAAYCVSVANGTDALELALRAIGVSKEDKVLTVANAGAYSTTAILAIGAMPEYVDVNEDTLLMSVEHLRSIISKNIRAIIVTHLYGQAAPIDTIFALAADYNIPVIEDCAQAHGAMINGRKVGSFGALGCFSFYPTKNLGASGDGGAVITNDALLAKRVQMLRQYGWQSKYEVALLGGRNSRLDELQAAILRVKLPHLDTWNRRRYEISLQYVQNIKHPLVKLPTISEGSYVGHLFVIRVQQRECLREYLRQCQIMSEIHYPIPDYRQPALLEWFPNVCLPLTEKVSAEILTLPCFPEMSDNEVQKVINVVNSWSI